MRQFSLEEINRRSRQARAAQEDEMGDTERDMRMRALFEEYREIFYSIPGIVHVTFYTDDERSVTRIVDGELKPYEDGFIIWVENKEIQGKLKRLLKDVDGMSITIKEIIKPS